MTKIFISYRRDDSQYVTDSIHDYFKAHFEDGNVFIDVESIPFGVNFRDYLAEQIATHDVVLVIIGPDWARIMRERADQPNDFVRIEIESALAQKKLVIPVLVKEAKMPNFTDFPESIGELQWLNSAEIRRKPRFEDDCQHLIGGIAQLLGKDVAQKSNKQLQFSLPEPFSWVNIPAGQVTLSDAMGTHDVSAFKISKYPITVGQYGLFVDDNGYQNADYWSNLGWQWREQESISTPRYWQDLLWHIDAHPVVGISWYEAHAFSQWLGYKMAKNTLLPTEQQWQRAAQGTDHSLKS